jgi:molybdenum cofactor synthesis domain-containing protein
VFIARRCDGHEFSLAPLVREYTSVDDALSQVKARLRLNRTVEVVPVLQSYARVCAGDLAAPANVPAYSTSHMDGYAVAAADLHSATSSHPKALKVIGALRPGGLPRRSISRGESVMVATGARLPDGADTVIPRESVEARARCILVSHAPGPGSYVFESGGDVRRGERILARGRVIRAQDIGLLITLGFSEVSVWTKPRISVIATGTELTASTRPKAGKVPDSHSPVFLRLCQALCCIGVGLGTVGDDPRNLTKLLRSALARSDFVLTLGGTSAGKHDLVVDAVSRLRPETIVHGIRMDRGRVTGVASVRGKPILMMPGPIQGAMNAFLLLGIPLIETLAGITKAEFEIHCSLGETWEARERFSAFRKVVYVKLKDGGKTVARPLLAETESIKVLSDADGYIVVPEDVKQMNRGDPVIVRLLPGFSSAW